MKYLILLFFFPLFLLATSFNVQISFSGEPALAVKTISNAFYALGYRFDIHSINTENSSGELQGTAAGNKPISASLLAEGFKEQGIEIESERSDQKTLIMSVNVQNALWNVPLLGSDEGTELKRSYSAQWFRVDEGQSIRIEPPYGSEWYPDIAVFDKAMHLLYSQQSHETKETFEAELPSGAYYLKVSNLQGMKVLREGMWIESKSLGRQ